MSVHTTETVSFGNLLLSPTRVDTVTRNGTKALVFAETDRKFFGVFYAGDIHGWRSTEWFKPEGNYIITGNPSPLDLNLTNHGIAHKDRKRRKEKALHDSTISEI